MWLAGAALSILIAAQFALNRNAWWFVVPLVVSAALIGWFLLGLSRTEITVERDAGGTRWLRVEGANLPHQAVSKSLTVPKSARRNALGRQLDPAAFLVTRAWVDEHVLLVLDDPADPTPYWLISSKDPEALRRAFVPGV